MRTPEAVWRRSARAIPALAWLSVAAAIIAVAFVMFRVSAMTQPLSIGLLVSTVEPAAAFILAAGVIISARRWPAARPWLLTAAAAFAIQGLLDAGLQVWLYWMQTAPVEQLLGWSDLLLARGIVVVTLRVAAPTLLAVGLWRIAPSVRASTRQRAAIGVLAVIGLAAAAAGLELIVHPGVGGAAVPTEYQVLYVIEALIAPAFAALAISAVRAMRARDWLPAFPIAVGAGTAALAAGWLDWLTQRQWQELPFGYLEWLVTLPNALVLMGLLAVAAGFAVAGLSDEPTRRLRIG